MTIYAFLMKSGYVYILTNQPNGTLYIGVTSDLRKRIWQHKNKHADGFTAKYHLDKLVYYEIFEDIESAIYREKRLKEWQRKWKISLIQKMNPLWKDLYAEII